MARKTCAYLSTRSIRKGGREGGREGGKRDAAVIHSFIHTRLHYKSATEQKKRSVLYAA